MNQEVVHAPPLPIMLRKMALMLVLSAVIVISAERLLFPWLHTYLTTAAGSEAYQRAQLVMAGIGAFVISIALWVFWLGYRVFLAKQVPLPGTFVLRDTPVKRGRQAIFAGVILMTLSGLLALLGLATILVLKLVAHQ